MGFRDKFKKDSSKNEDESFESLDDGKNFKHLVNLIGSAKGNVILDSDIILSDGEEEKYSEGIMLDVDDVVIDGRGHAIDACGKARVFKVTGNNVILKNITFKNGLNEEGGAIYIDNFAKLEILDCTFTDNLAERKGGAIINLGEISLEGVSFVKNTSQGIGGAVYNEVVGDISLVNCSFKDNASENDGGVLDNFGKVILHDSDFTKNGSRQGTGGAIINQGGGSIVLNDCSFKDNVSQKGGGAIINFGRFNLDGADFSNNASNEGSGGALNNQVKGKISLSNSSFSGNDSQTGGGALINFGKLSLDGTDFAKNISNEGSGGAINNQTDGIISLNDCSFSDNVSQDEGGALNNLGEIGMERVDFIQNASNGGGAIYNSTDGNLNISKSSFIGNTSQMDGGAINNNRESSDLNVNDCRFNENRAGASGGAIVNWGNSVIDNSEFKDNLAKSDGNDINFQKGSFKISNAKFNDIMEESIFLVNDDLVEMENCEFMELEYDKILNEFSERNFRYLDMLVRSGTNEIVLDSDILLDEGEENRYPNGIKLEADGLVIDGNGYSIDAEGKARIFMVNGNITLKNMTIKNGYSKGAYGGAIYQTDSSSLKVINVDFIGNIADVEGGAIVNFGDLVLEDSNFENNHSKSNGGAIFNNTEGTLNISKSNFLENVSDKHGGAIFNSGNSDIFKTEFIKNSSQEDGGAINNNSSSSDFHVDDCRFMENVSHGGGGALVSWGNSVIKNSEFEANISKIGGDDINNQEGNLELSNVKFCNTEKKSIFSTNSANLESCEFMEQDDDENNESMDRNFDYLDKLVNSGVKTIILNSDIILNDDELDKYREGIALVFDDLIIDGNGFAIDAMGKSRIFSVDAKNIVLKNMTLKNAYSQEAYGGAIYQKENSDLKIVNVHFTDNNADQVGGAIASFGNIEIDDCEFTNNDSKDCGGAIYNFGDLSIIDSRFKENTSQYCGGAIFNFGDLSIFDSIFYDNVSQKFAGAIYNSGDLSMGRSSFQDNIAHGGAGAVLTMRISNSGMPSH